MILFTRHARGAALLCCDGEAGTIKDVLFEDDSWKVRYLSVRLGLPIVGKKVLLAPQVVSGRTEDGRFVTTLSRRSLEAAPAVEEDPPISREQELPIHEHFAWPVYWGGPVALFPGSYTLATAAVEGLPNLEPLDREGGVSGAERERENHLRSCNEVLGYRIHAVDGEEVGEIVDFAFDDGTWEVAHLVIDTAGWFAGKHVAAPPSWVTSIEWSTKRVNFNVTREFVERVEHHDRATVRARASKTFGPTSP